MPCTYYTPAEIAAQKYEELRQEKELVNKITRLLCISCDELDRIDADLSRDGVLKEVYDWWEEHKKADAERVAIELKAKEAVKKRIREKQARLMDEYNFLQSKIDQD
jgi:hypothetical protein